MGSLVAEAMGLINHHIIEAFQTKMDDFVEFT